MGRVQIRHKGGDFHTAEEALGCAGKEFNASSAKWSRSYVDHTHPSHGESDWNKYYLS